MNNIHTVQAFVGEDTRVRAQPDVEVGLSLTFGVGDSDIILFVATLNPTKAELGSAARFLDDLILHTVELKAAVVREMAKGTGS